MESHEINVLALFITSLLEYIKKCLYQRKSSQKKDILYTGDFKLHIVVYLYA